MNNDRLVWNVHRLIRHNSPDIPWCRRGYSMEIEFIGCFSRRFNILDYSNWVLFDKICDALYNGISMNFIHDFMYIRE